MNCKSTGLIGKRSGGFDVSRPGGSIAGLYWEVVVGGGLRLRARSDSGWGDMESVELIERGESILISKIET